MEVKFILCFLAGIALSIFLFRDFRKTKKSNELDFKADRLLGMIGAVFIFCVSVFMLILEIYDYMKSR